MLQNITFLAPFFVTFHLISFSEGEKVSTHYIVIRSVKLQYYLRTSFYLNEEKNGGDMKWLNVLDGDNLQHLTSNTLVQTFLFFSKPVLHSQSISTINLELFKLELNNQTCSAISWRHQKNIRLLSSNTEEKT